MRLRYCAVVAVVSIAMALPCLTTTRAYAGNRDDSAAEKLGLKLSLQCYTFRALTFFETVDEAAKLGIKYLEIYPGQKLKPGSKLYLHQRHERRGLPGDQEKAGGGGRPQAGRLRRGPPSPLTKRVPARRSIGPRRWASRSS